MLQMEQLIAEQKNEIERLRSRLGSRASGTPQPLPPPTEREEGDCADDSAAAAVGEGGGGRRAGKAPSGKALGKAPTRQPAEHELTDVDDEDEEQEAAASRNSRTSMAGSKRVGAPAARRRSASGERAPLVDLNARHVFTEGEIAEMRSAVASEAEMSDDEHQLAEEVSDDENVSPNEPAERGSGAGCSRRSSRWAKANAARRQTRTTGELVEGGEDDEEEAQRGAEGQQGVHHAEDETMGQGRPEGVKLNKHTVALWAGGSWQRAQVVSYSKKTGKHKLRYEDDETGKLRAHTMQEETWEVLATPADEPASFDPTASILRLPARAAGEKLIRSPARRKVTAGASLKTSARSPNVSKSPAPSTRPRRAARTTEPGEAENGENGVSAEAAVRPKKGLTSAAALAAAGIDDGVGIGDFTPRSQTRLAARQARQQYQKPRKPAANAPKIAFSGLLPADVDVLTSIAASLGGALVSDDELHTATHVVLGARGTKGAPGAPKRTVKVLQAILRGAWLLSDEWLYKSVDSAALLPEAEFETTAFPGAKLAREKREIEEGPLASLAGLAVAVVDQDADTCERLRQLAAGAGATVTSTTRAAVWIGGKASSGGASSRRARSGSDAPLLSAEWLYDTISNGERMPFAPYSSVAA